MDFWQTLPTRLLGNLGSLVQGFAAILVVALLLGLLNRLLQRSHGGRFRNQTVMLGGVFLGILLVILMLPIDTTTRGQLLQLTGIIISAAIALSSSTFIANAMAGIMLKSVRNFRTGDWLEVEGVAGRVSERGLFHTEIQTPDRDLTTLPNLLLATRAVKVVRESGTIVGATVSLGYDVHHTRCENLLVDAARSIGLQDAFVQVLQLGDYSVTYRVAGLLTETKQLMTYRSRLQAAMLDFLHDGGVEIVSPLFNNARQMAPERSFIPRPERAQAGPATDAAPVEVVFDKAEEAESLSTLQHERELLEDDLKALRKDLKAAEEADKAPLESQIDRLERRGALLDEQIARATAEKEDLPPSEA